MAVFLSPVGGAGAQFCDNNGNPLNGGKLYTYAAGTTTPAATYTSSAGTTFHPNPIILNAGGRVPDSGEIWLSDSVSYKFVLKTSADVLLATWDNITGINSNFVNFAAQEEVITATAGQTVFTLTSITYTPGSNNLQVFVDGVNQIVDDSYLETDSTTVTFTAGLHVGALVKFTTAVSNSSGIETDSALVTYDPPFTGSETTTVEAKLAQYISVKDFGAVGDGVTDDTAAIQAAIDYVASLSGDAHDGSQTFGSRFGDAKGIQFNASRYAVSQTIVLKGNVSVAGNGGAIVALSGFTSGDPIVSTDGIAYFTGAVENLILDGNDLDVKGLNIENVLGVRWSNITVLNCQDDGISYSTGADFVLDGFFVSCSTTTVSTSVAGLKVTGSDAVFTNGVCRFNPIGVYINGGGNVEYSNIHCWGAYHAYPQYMNFYVHNSYRNSFVNCYADSPTKQDYAQANNATVGGLPNGGVGFYVDSDSTGSQQNKFTNCRVIVNWANYTASGNAANQIAYTYFGSLCYENSVVNLIEPGGTPAGQTAAFASPPYLYLNVNSSNNNLIFNPKNYTQGTWTPTDASGAGLTFTNVSGRYTRLGNYVSCTAALTYPTTANTNTIVLGGLPVLGAIANSGSGVTGYSSAGFQLFFADNAATDQYQMIVSAVDGTPRTNASMSGKTIKFTYGYYVNT